MTAPQLPGYAELNCLSNFSFLRGASHPEELVERAHRLGYAALAITDECSVSGVVRAHVAAKAKGLPLIIGSEFRLTDGDRPGPKIVVLCTDRVGYGHLCEFITLGRRRASKGTYDLRVGDLQSGLPGCLVVWLPGLPDLFGDYGEQLDLGDHLTSCFAERLWIGVNLHLTAHDKALLAAAQHLGRDLGLPVVATGDVHMHSRGRRALQDTLTATRVSRPIHECGFALFPNGERHLRARMRLAQLYPGALLAETLVVADCCRFSLDELRYEYPEEVVPPGETPAAYLRRLTEAGAAVRFPTGTPAKVRTQLDPELALIAELGYEAYFLTVYDIVRFARDRGILCQGRGSAANSAVCYCLGITEVDPARMSVLFERFISRERNEPPDIDVDFEHQRREEVIQYLYGKYGRDRAALTANLITYRPKSALRDVGKALGLDLAQVDRLTKTVAWWDHRDAVPERMREAGFDPDSRIMRMLVGLVDTLLGFPRHLSQHPGGFVLARGRLSSLVPIENAAMPERSVIQWDKDDLDALGLLKVDVLALGMLSAIRRSLDFIGQRRGAPFRMQDVPAEDPTTYAMLGRGDSVGTFQVESRAQMAMLPRLAPKTFYDLVIEVAIVRPGPIQGGMVHPYLRRRQGLEPVDFPSDAVRSVLARTLGVPIFQEQAMQLAIVAGGFTPGEADQLRRAMAAWKRKGGLGPFEDRLRAGMRQRGYSDEWAERIIRQIRGFGEYGFPESHAASFALLTYVSSWIKCHEPAAFLAALLNSQPLGFYAPSQLIQDAKRHGVEVRPTDVTVSTWDSALEEAGASQPAVRLGLSLVGGLSQMGAERIVSARATRAFQDAEDLARRAGLDRKDMQTLARANALAPLAGHRRDAQWQVAGIEAVLPVLAPTTIREVRPVIASPTEGEDILADYHAQGFTLGRHPLALLRPQLTARKLASAAELHTYPHGRLARTTGIVTHRQRPETANGVVFITLEDETGYVQVVVWARVAERQRKVMLTARLLTVYGVWETDGKVHHLIAGRMADETALLGELATNSRDFR